MAYSQENLAAALKKLWAEDDTAFGRALAADPDKWGMMTPATPAPEPEAGGVDPKFTSELQAINERYNPSNKEIDMDIYHASTATDPRAKYAEALKAANPNMIQAEEAESQVRALLEQYGYSDAASLKTSVKGSHNDSYMNLGAAGNRIYNTGAYNPQGGGSRDVDTSGFANAPIGSSSLTESGKDSSIWDTKGFQLGAGLLAPFTGGLSVAAQKALSASDGQTLHGDDYAKAALAVATPYINKGFAGKIGDVGFNWGEGVQAGAASGATSAALEGAIKGDFDLGDIAKGGLTGGAMAGGKDFLLDTLQTGSRQGLWDEAVAKGITGEGNIREYIARNLNSSDFGKLVGPDSLLGGSELDTSWLNDGINAIGKGAEAIGVDKLLNPLFDTMGNAYTGNKAFQESKAAVEDAQRRLGTANDLTRPALTEALDNARTQHQFNVDQIQQGEIRYDERFLTDSEDERGDSPLFGITRENPFGGGTGTTTGEGSADSPLPTQDTNQTPITDDILGVIGGGDGSGTQSGTGGGPSDNTQLPTQDNDQVLQDQILEAIAAEEDPLVRQGMQEDLLALEGDGDLMGTDDPFADPQGSGVGEGNLTLGGYDDALPPTGNENLPPTGNENLPPTGNENLPPTGEDVLPPTGDESLPPVSDEDLPPSGSDNLPAGTPKRIRKVAKQLDDELFRLARVMQVLPMNELQKVSLQQRMREIQGHRASLSYDATAILDPQSSEYIQKVKEGEEDASNIVDPIQQAIEANA